MNKKLIVQRILLAAWMITVLGGYHCWGQTKRKLVSADVCIYGATASGIMAAIAVKKEGRTAVIIEPGKWVGGILGAGIKPIQDCPNFEAVGGATRETMMFLGMQDGKKQHTAEELRAAMRTTSPADIRKDFLKVLSDHKIEILYDHRVSSVVKAKEKIVRVLFDLAPFDKRGLPPEHPESTEDLEVSAAIFIDASYEGELMARAGVSFMNGRESSFDYDEENAGVREPTNLTPIDPFVVPGSKQSGLLPLIDTDHERPVGASDFYTQAYNFRFYVTPDKNSRVPFPIPEGYNAKDYELVGRYVAYLTKQIPEKDKLFQALRDVFPGWMNSGEYNYQRNSLITMAPVGVSHLYINGDYATKSRVWRYHQDYLAGLHRFLSTDPRVPEEFRNETAALGLDKRHHPDTQGWPHQLYIRVSRRLVGAYTVHAADVYNKTSVSDPIGLAQYGIDTYPSRRIAVEKEGTMYVGLEGKMFIGGSQGPTNVPYPIPYRAITPLKSQSTNLLVPVCFSATHLGYASARMEPVFMICGESAGLAAVQALAEGKAVQDIDMATYIQKLKTNGQRLVWPVATESKNSN